MAFKVLDQGCWIRDFVRAIGLTTGRQSLYHEDEFKMYLYTDETRYLVLLDVVEDSKLGRTWK